MKNGSLELMIQVSGEDEIMRWVLSWGKDAQVLQTKTLKDRIKKEIAAMAKEYR